MTGSKPRRKVRVEFPRGDRTFGLSAIEGEYSEKFGSGLVGDFTLEEEGEYEIFDLPADEPKNLFAVVKDCNGDHWLKERDGWRLDGFSSTWPWSEVVSQSPVTVLFEGVERK